MVFVLSALALALALALHDCSSCCQDDDVSIFEGTSAEKTEGGRGSCRLERMVCWMRQVPASVFSRTARASCFLELFLETCDFLSTPLLFYRWNLLYVHRDRTRGRGYHHQTRVHCQPRLPPPLPHLQPSLQHHLPAPSGRNTLLHTWEYRGAGRGYSK